MHLFMFSKQEIEIKEQTCPMLQSVGHLMCLGALHALVSLFTSIMSAFQSMLSSQ